MNAIDLSALIRAAMPYCRDPNGWANNLYGQMRSFGITTPQRIACFLAQVGIESTQLNTVEENLSYSAERLVAVWPAHFATVDAAAPYAHNPEVLANHVYAFKNGNGDEASGDGYRFRGRGLLQITGRGNYQSEQNSLKSANIILDLIGNPDQLAHQDIAAYSACAFWQINNLNLYADRIETFPQDAFRQLTRKINGGVTDLDQRTALLHVLGKELDLQL